jgi:hypothetical protein
MLERIKSKWAQLKRYPPGQRFEKFRRAEQGKPHQVRVLYVGLAVLSLIIGVVLVFIPGPAVLFFALAGALLATQSLWVARKLDRLELNARSVAASFRRWRRKRARGELPRSV